MLKVAWTEIYAHPLPENHRFPMEKYNLLPEQLIYEGTLSQSNFFTPQSLPESLVLNTHTAEYWEKLKYKTLTRQEERRTGFPWSRELIARETIIMQGTLEAAKYALDFGAAMNIAGGTHHAFTNRG